DGSRRRRGRGPILPPGRRSSGALPRAPAPGIRVRRPCSGRRASRAMPGRSSHGAAAGGCPVWEAPAMAEKEAPRARTSRMSGKERREQLLSVGRRVFAEKGFDMTTDEEIAERAEVSK